jgi:hypothetical protein
MGMQLFCLILRMHKQDRNEIKNCWTIHKGG